MADIAHLRRSQWSPPLIQRDPLRVTELGTTCTRIRVVHGCDVGIGIDFMG